MQYQNFLFKIINVDFDKLIKETGLNHFFKQAYLNAQDTTVSVMFNLKTTVIEKREIQTLELNSANYPELLDLTKVKSFISQKIDGNNLILDFDVIKEKKLAEKLLELPLEFGQFVIKSNPKILENEALINQHQEIIKQCEAVIKEREAEIENLKKDNRQLKNQDEINETLILEARKLEILD